MSRGRKRFWGKDREKIKWDGDGRTEMSGVSLCDDLMRGVGVSLEVEESSRGRYHTPLFWSGCLLPLCWRFVWGDLLLPFFRPHVFEPKAKKDSEGWTLASRVCVCLPTSTEDSVKNLFTC